MLTMAFLNLSAEDNFPRFKTLLRHKVTLCVNWLVQLHSESCNYGRFSTTSIDLWQHCNESHWVCFFFFWRHTDTVRDLYPTYIKSNNEQVPTSSREQSCWNMDRTTRDRRNPYSSWTGIRFSLLTLSFVFCLLAAQLQNVRYQEI